MPTLHRRAEAILASPVVFNPARALSSTRWSDAAKARLVLLVALVQGLLYLVLVPPWQHYDEPTHFEYAALIAERLRLPAPGDVSFTLRREIAASMLQLGFYRNLPPPNLLADDGEIWIGISELGHPPLFYVLASLPLHLVRYLDITAQLYAARSVSLILFLLTVMIAAGLMRDLTPAGHSLRWAVPLALVLLPPFADVMTSVNNDVGVVLFMSCFLWAAVRIIRGGINFRRLLWLLMASAASILTKNTGSLTLPLVPLVLIASIWITRPGLRRWIVAVSTVALVALPPLLFRWGDAAGWYRWEQSGTQATATRAETTAAVHGRHAIVRDVSHADRAEYLLSPVQPKDAQRVAGRTVTVGGWLWADRVARTDGLGLVIGKRDTVELIPVTNPITLTTTPTFVRLIYKIPPETQVLHAALFANPSESTALPLRISLDGAMLLEGEFREATTPAFADASGQVVLWSGQRARNLVRNPSGEMSWPRLRPSVDRLLLQYARRSPSQTVAALFDWRRTAPVLLQESVPAVIDSFFGRLGWGDVRSTGRTLANVLRGIVFMTLLGSAAWFVGRHSGKRRGMRPAFIVLGMAAVLGWTGAITRSLPMLRAVEALPLARYAFPVAIPTVLMLVGGWRALWPRRYQEWGTALLLAVLVILDLMSLIAIRTHF